MYITLESQKIYCATSNMAVSTRLFPAAFNPNHHVPLVFLICLDITALLAEPAAAPSGSYSTSSALGLFIAMAAHVHNLFIVSASM